MSFYDPATSDLAQVPLATLQQWQAQTLQALHDLSTGNKVEVAAYTQGDGTKSVTYTRANINDLRAWLAKLNAQLGIGKYNRMLSGACIRFSTNLDYDKSAYY